MLKRCFFFFVGSWVFFPSFFCTAIKVNMKYQETESTKWRIMGSPLMSAAETTTTGLACGSKFVFVEIVETTDLHSSPRTRTRSVRRVAAKHSHTRAKFGATKGDHMFPS